MPKTSYITLDSKGRATLPEEVRESLGVGPGDFVLLERTESGGYVMIPAVLVPKDQRWFQHPEMQSRVRKAETEIAGAGVRRESVAALAARVAPTGGTPAGTAKRAAKARSAKSKER